MTNGKVRVFRFLDVELRQREFYLVKNGEVLTVEPKAFRLLLYLLEHPQKLISKEELLNAVWGDAAVTENSLTQNIAKLRRLLDDDAREPRYIATVATVGYRLVCDVEVSDEVDGSSEPPSRLNGHPKSALSDASTDGAVKLIANSSVGSQPALRHGIDAQVEEAAVRREVWKRLFAGVAVLAVGLSAAAWYLHRPLPPPHITAFNRITHDGKVKYLGGTDGTRLYLGSYDPVSVMQVAVSGGEAASLPVPVPLWVDLWDVSPGGSSLLLSRNQEKTPYKLLWIVKAPGGPALPIGPAKNAAFSPDGRMIAYCAPDGDIFLVHRDGTENRKIASAPTREFNVASATDSIVWSPDGKSLRFVRDNQFWEISTDGANLHPLLPRWNPNSWQGWGRWTADGHFFIFQAGGPSPQESELYALDERRGLLRKPPVAPIRLTLGPIQWGPPVPGKDGKTIFADGNSPRGELMRLDPQTRKFEPFLGGISAQFVTFSRDGKSVAYVSYPEGVLWKADRNGSNPIRLSDPPLMACLPRWSPDGSRILFEDGSNPDHSEIYLVSAQGGIPQRLFPGSKESLGDADWSADGNSIVFDAPPGWNAKAVIRVLDTKTSQISTLPGSRGLFSPRWSPDGKFISATSSLDSRSLSVFDARTRKWSKIFENATGYMGYQEWSSDSKVVYIGSTDCYYRVGASSGKPECIADLKGLRLTGASGAWTGLDTTTDAPLVLRDIGTDDIYALTLSEE